MRLFHLAVFTVPVNIGFDLESSAGSSMFVFDIIVDVFFFLDMCVTARTCYYDKTGRLVHESNKVLWNYLKGFFIIDRSVPVMYRPGELNNAFDTVKLSRIVE